MFGIIKVLFGDNEVGGGHPEAPYSINVEAKATADSSVQTEGELVYVTPDISHIKPFLLSMQLWDQDSAFFNELSGSCVVLVSNKTKIRQGQDCALLKGVQIKGDVQGTVLIRRIEDATSELPQSTLLIQKDLHEDGAFSLMVGGVESFRDMSSYSDKKCGVRVMSEEYRLPHGDTIQDILICTSFLLIGAAAMIACAFFIGEHILYATHLLRYALIEVPLSSTLGLFVEVRFGSSSYERSYALKNTDLASNNISHVIYEGTRSPVEPGITQNIRTFDALELDAPDLKLFALTLQNVTGLMPALFKLLWHNITFSYTRCTILEHDVHEMLYHAMDRWGSEMVKSATVVCNLAHNREAFECVEDPTFLLRKASGRCSVLNEAMLHEKLPSHKLTLVFSVNATVMNIPYAIFSRTKEITATHELPNTLTDSKTRLIFKQKTPSNSDANSKTTSETNEFSASSSDFTNANTDSFFSLSKLPSSASSSPTVLSVVFSESKSSSRDLDSSTMSKGLLVYPIGDCAFYIGWVNAHNSTLWPLLGGGACNRTQLIVRDQKINTSIAEIFAPALQQMVNVADLRLINCSLENDATIILAPSIAVLKNLTLLSFLQNKIGVVGAYAISNFIGDMKSLSVFSMSTNEIGDEGAAVLGDSLRNLTSLSGLNFLGNNISVAGCAELLGELHAHNPSATLYC